MTDLQQDTGHSEHTAPVEAWDSIAALYDEHVAPGESELGDGRTQAGRAEGGRQCSGTSPPAPAA